MPDYFDPVDAAQRRPRGVSAGGGLGGAYNQTDVMHDPNYLIANLAHANPRIRQQAEIALGQLNRDAVIGQRYEALEQRYDALQQQQLNFEANQRRQIAHDSAMEFNRQLSTDRETEIDEQGHGLLQGMGHLDAALRRGEIDKNTYDDSLLELGARFPLATRHPEAARHFEFAITEADKQNAYNERRAITQAAKLGAKYGIEPQFDENGRPSIQLTQQAALQTPKGRNEALGMMNKEMHAKYGIPTGVGSLFNPITPHSSDDENQTINLPYADPKAEGGIGKLKVPYPLFNQMKADFNDRYFALNPQAGSATGAQPKAAPAANPRTVLAQRAIDDPNASEAHKAAARKILGLQ